jgi:transcriptional regulator with XRE-family HTH domain
MTTIAVRSEVREFLSSRRARITPEQAGLPAYGGNRRVKGLRREEVAMLAGVSVDYYVRMERGNLAGASESVLDALASALQLDEAEREHLYALARESAAGAAVVSVERRGLFDRRYTRYSMPSPTRPPGSAMGATTCSR